MNTGGHRLSDALWRLGLVIALAVVYGLLRPVIGFEATVCGGLALIGAYVVLPVGPAR